MTRQAAIAMSHTLRLDFSRDSVSMATPGTARRWACDHVTSNGLAATVPDVGLIVSELVTNAVKHTDGPVQLRLQLDPVGVRVEVTDGSTRIPVAREPHPKVPGGRGIHVVAAAASDWGYQLTAHGKTVWADIAVPLLAMNSQSAMPLADSDSQDLRRLRSVTDSAFAYLAFEELVETLLDRACESLEADTAAVLLLDSDSDELVVTAAKGIEDDARQRVRVPVGKGFSGRVAALGHAITTSPDGEIELIGRSLRRKGLRAMLGVPLMVGGTVTGVMHVGRTSPRQFDESDTHLLRIVADRVALAGAAHRSTVERDAAAAIQRSLLPPRLPSVEGLGVAARYLPGQAGLVSGDWYDLVRLDEHRVGLVIGDVVGSGLPAAVVMGRMRSALRAYSLETLDPADVLRRLDRKAHHFEAGQMTTVLYAVLDVRTGQLDVCSAGHLRPILVQSDGTAAFVDLPVGPPLSVVVDAQRSVVHLEMPHGSLLLLYTDGLVEKRGAPIREGLQRLLATVTADEPDVVCDDVISSLLDGREPSDDVAVLAARR